MKDCCQNLAGRAGTFDAMVRSTPNCYRSFAIAVRWTALKEIRILLRFRSAPDENCREVNALLDTHIGHVEERIAELQSLEDQLRALRDKCSSGRSAEHCGILQGLGDAPGDREASGDNHVPRTHSTKR